MLLIISRFILIVVLIALFVLVIAYIAKKSSPSKTPDKLVRNYEMRFEPQSNKYYIVNVLSNREEPITNWYGGRILYKNLIEADYVLNKLQTTK